MAESVNTNNISLKGELLRKLIHYSSAAIPIGYFFLAKSVVLLVIIPLLAGMLIVELLKYKSKTVHGLYFKLFGYLLRQHEYDTLNIRINGASWVIIADIICIIFFPKYIAITSMLLLSLADSTSAIIGRVYGKKQYAPNRSYAGTITFFLVGVAVVMLTPKYVYSYKEYLIYLAALTGTTYADSVNLPIDDNFTIPVVCAVLLYVLYLIFLPVSFGV